MSHALPPLTLNGAFTQAFVAADAPCLALGMVESQSRQTGFIGLRTCEAIPPNVLQTGFNFGHCLLGSDTFEVIQFVFHFYGFQTYNALINPNNPIAQAVLNAMIAEGNYFFFALDVNSGMTTAFKAGFEKESMAQLKKNLLRIQNSTTTANQYQHTLSLFRKNPEPEGVLLNWVCQDNPEYLNLSRDRLELTPA